ncbi:MAG: DUF4349 domain-containing protein [Propionibacteriaceae bacterium]|nr:DUF4349 domain-containing protein [Propionibacteriaceae bacterium]
MKRQLGIGKVLGLGVLVGVMALTGCSSGSGTASAPEGAGAPDYGYDTGNAPNNPMPSADRLIARTASVTLVVGDVKAAAASLHDVATTLNGWVTSESITVRSDDSTLGYGSIQLSVPSEKLDDALSQIETVGDMTNRSIQSEDVTEQVADTDSRIATMRASIARLQELISRSGSVSDIAAVEAQLTQREADLEALLAVQKSLSQRVATATIDVSVSTKASGQQTSGVGSVFLDAWHALGTAASYLLIFVASVLPWAAVAALVVVPIVVVRRKRRAAAVSAAASHPMQATPTPTDTPAVPVAVDVPPSPQPAATPDVAAPPARKRTSRAKPQ